MLEAVSRAQMYVRFCPKYFLSSLSFEQGLWTLKAAVTVVPSLTPQVISFGLSLKLMKLLPDFLRNVAKCDSLVHCCSFYQVRVQFLPGKFLIIFNSSVMIYCQIKTTDTLLPWCVLPRRQVDNGPKKGFIAERRKLEERVWQHFPKDACRKLVVYVNQMFK